MPERRENASVYLLGAGLLFYLIAAMVVVFAPWMGQSRKQAFMENIKGERIAVPRLTDAQLHGRIIYLREGCMVCHSQVVRGDWVRVGDGSSLELVSKAGDEERYGPISQPGESGFDRPHLFGTRRIGPDLARIGGKYADAWHLSHFLDPRAVVPGSIMPKFKWLYIIEDDESGKIKRSVPTVELMDLISYVQGLGINIGDWRGQGAVEIEDMEAWVSSQDQGKLIGKGKKLFTTVGCVGCHGAGGKGDGAAAANFPVSNKPRNYFDKDAFKWGWEGGDIRASISRGRAPYMPAHPQLTPEQVAALAEYVRSFSGE